MNFLKKLHLNKMSKFKEKIEFINYNEDVIKRMSIINIIVLLKLM